VYVSTVQLTAGNDVSIELFSDGSSQIGKVLAADVIKITPLVRKKVIAAPKTYLDLGILSSTDTIVVPIRILNLGTETLTITGFTSRTQSLVPIISLPFSVPPMGNVEVTLRFHYPSKKKILDTLFISSDDPAQPAFPIVFAADVMTYVCLRHHKQIFLDKSERSECPVQQHSPFARMVRYSGNYSEYYKCIQNGKICLCAER
jgi:hypothetical protein